MVFGNGLLKYNAGVFLGMHITWWNPRSDRDAAQNIAAHANLKRNELVKFYTCALAMDSYTKDFSAQDLVAATEDAGMGSVVFTNKWLRDVRKYLRLWLLYGYKFDATALREGCVFPTDNQNGAAVLPMGPECLTQKQ